MTGQSSPKVSIVVATYAPGDALRRVIDSLDAQTMPQDEFEVVFVDDGSPDDTYDRRRRVCEQEQRQELLEKLAVDGGLGARVVADADGARLTGGASLPPGHYLLYARRDGKPQRTAGRCA